MFGQSGRDSDSSKESLAIQDNTDLSVHTADHVEHTHQSEEKSDDAILTTDKRDATQEASMNQTEQEAAKEIEQPKDASEQANDQPEQKSSHDEKQQGTEEQANVTTGTAANEKTDLVTPVLTQSEEQQATEHDPFETVEITNDVQEHEVYEQIVTEVSVIEEQESSTILSKEQINKPNQISEMTVEKDDAQEEQKQEEKEQETTIETVSLLEVAQKHEVSAVTEQVVHTEVITKDIKQETINDIKTTENVDDEATTAENIKDSAESKVAETINSHNENKVDDTVKQEDKVTEKSNDESKVPEIAKNDDSCKASVATKADDESKVADKNEDGASSAEVEHKELVEQGDVKTEEAKQEQVDTIVKEEPVEAQENKVEENVKREASVNKEPVNTHEDQHQTNARTEQTSIKDVIETLTPENNVSPAVEISASTSTESADVNKVETGDADTVQINSQGTAIADGIESETEVTTNDEPYKPDEAEQEEHSLLDGEEHLIETVVHTDELKDMMEEAEVNNDVTNKENGEKENEGKDDTEESAPSVTPENQDRLTASDHVEESSSSHTEEHQTVS